MTKLRCCLISLCILTFALSAMAQIQNGEFAGTVTDPSGAAVANAKITIGNAATGLSVSATSNATGAFQVAELPPGTYKITIEAAGFKTFNDVGVTLNAGSTARIEAKMTLGQAREIVEVTGESSQVNTEEAKLAITVSSTQIENLPLNGRNVYDLMQQSPGAVNVNGVDFENGHGTVVNGLREDFNGFLINGVANKGLSGGVNNVPIEDTVQEFQQLQLNMSAQYGNSAGSINNLVSKSGTNAYHGSVWEYFRNDKLDANYYFLNQQAVPKTPLRFNQFGGTFGGSIIKDKLFFFGSYQGDRFRSSGTPENILVESPEWEQAVISGQPNSVAALLYQNFKPSVAGTTNATVAQYFGTDLSSRLCNNSYPQNDPVDSQIGSRLLPIFGVTQAEITSMTAMGCNNTPAAPFIGTVGDRTTAGSVGNLMPVQNSSVAVFGTQTQTLGNLFNGNEASARLDYNWNTNNRTFVQFNWFKSTDGFGPCIADCSRGFYNPSRSFFPNGQLSYVRTISPTIVNEFRAGYTQNNTGIVTKYPGVPQAYFDDGTAGFGSYAGYPQFFKEHDYSYGDMVSISHGKHSIKFGVDVKRNIENSEFNVARPSFEMFDLGYFAADAPAEQIAGIDPGFADGTTPHLASNVRHFRNVEFGGYFQDDWKATKRVTLNLGLRYDIFTRHTEENNLATTFILGSGSNIAQQVANANTQIGGTLSDGTICNPSNPNTVILAGVCGPGGFAAAKSLGAGDHNDFGPRVGFAWDVFGDGKTSLRGGFGVSYESTLYNPLSNSRWNPPYYSFNLATGPLNGGTEQLIYGPMNCGASSCTPAAGVTPTYLGAGSNPNMGTGAQATGNLTGWAPFNPDTAYLTGIVLPQGIRDPYVYNDFLSIQRDIAPKTVLEVDYVGTIAHKLFRAQNINRQAGGGLPEGSCVTDNLGRHLCSLVTAINPSGLPNSNYGTLRNWQNAVNSAYNGLQVSLKKQMSHGLLFNVAYTYSHSIDEGSTWHSGATTASGGSGGDGYSTDQSLPGLDRGNSVFDIRQRLTLNYVYELPGKNLHGFEGAVLGGWKYSGIWAMQTGAHWAPYTSKAANLVKISDGSTPCSASDVNSGNCENIGGDYNLDSGTSSGGRNDRPNSSIANFGGESRSTWALGWCGTSTVIKGCASPNQAGLPSLTVPCLGCTGNLGRNQFLGPGQWSADMTLGKEFRLTERAHLKFEWQAFNVFNRANFLLATTGGGANNHITYGNFGQAAGTLNPRQMQFDLKLSF
jgi:Carboxypeptidase regulatory-like domain/TonB dependent receptor